MSPAFSINRLEIAYPEFALGPINLDVAPGTVLGLIGPNGAGKTTLINSLAGLIKADTGEVSIFGKAQDPEDPAWRQKIGYVGDEHPFFERWSAARNLEFLSSLYPAWNEDYVQGLAARLGLPMNKKVMELSRGNRTKLSLVAALGHFPKLLVLDEPTAGLDPAVRAEFMDVLREYQEDEERAILFSTNILSDLGRVAGELAFMHQGKVLLRDRQDRLQDRWRQIFFRLSGKCPFLAEVFGHRQDGEQHRVVTRDGEKTMVHLRALNAEEVRVYPLGLDEIIVAIFKQAEVLEWERRP
jgi:ABC-2 type transport system ATP-binding protein